MEDIEDANDLLKAKIEAKEFVPYDQFRETFLSPL
jgi:hypothetical protein